MCENHEKPFNIGKLANSIFLKGIILFFFFFFSRKHMHVTMLLEQHQQNIY